MPKLRTEVELPSKLDLPQQFLLSEKVSRNDYTSCHRETILNQIMALCIWSHLSQCHGFFNLDALAWSRFPLHTRNPRVCTSWGWLWPPRAKAVPEPGRGPLRGTGLPTAEHTWTTLWGKTEKHSLHCPQTCPLSVGSHQKWQNLIEKKGNFLGNWSM